MAIVKSTEGNVLYLTFSNSEKLNSLEPEDWNTMTEYLLQFELFVLTQEFYLYNQLTYNSSPIIIIK